MQYDVIVVGGGHAGVEACHAAATMGLNTLLCTLNIKAISRMSCNPSIGGSAKGIVVREIDALGGLMGICADYQYLQLKMLNTGKGPGVQCLRTQSDRNIYPGHMQELLAGTKNLTIKEGMVVALLHDEQKVSGVIMANGEEIFAKAVVITTGTYMEAQVLRGLEKNSSGPDGEKASLGLSKCLEDMGIEIYRLKTGTPPRIRKSSIDFSKASIQYGTNAKLAFSYTTKTYVPFEEQMVCHLIYTSPETHRVIKENINRSAQFNGQIKGVGPRYCPSIEGKITTFFDKARHQLFLEPETRDGDSIYIQGFATSMPRDVQELMVHSLPGFANAEILKYGYAIEYDAVVPTQFDATLRIKKYQGLYGAGQICGTSGYEEAAGLGIVAGINAALAVQGKEPFVLKRNESYIGVMIDDLVTKGANEPYRLLSSRAEYRLLLRHDNADLRLSDYGYKLGMLSEERYAQFLDKNAKIERSLHLLKTVYLGANKKNNDYLTSRGLNILKGGTLAFDMLKRPDIHYGDLLVLLPELNQYALDETGIMQLEVMVKYEGYIAKQEKEAKSFAKFENILLPEDLDYSHIDGLALEARQKLQRIKPRTIGQAGRVGGVNPSDISVLVLTLKRRGLL
ncbi:MAG: tRNA uridine-5-carboxymethylaminomethyl(34) synthesis enzyme MnmG [Bacteroidia bacterium]|nr:tRNA uridine-5-carboxymethylaminomethyl(34) synthesis enzyme MnmG [Bacteroidia bacterium]